MALPLLSSLARVSLFASPEARSSGASLTTADGRQLALIGARLRGDARGGIARLVLEQRFENRFAEPLDVTYRMPLPADGAVSGYAFEIGGRVITGIVDKKAAARERFERALVQGKTAALLEQQRADIFTQQIGNLPPGEALIARITIDQRLAWLPEGEWELRFPTVIGPRYVGSRDTEADARDTHVTVAPGGIAAGIQIAITIGDPLAGGRGAASPSHTLVHRADGSLQLEDAAALDRDIVVRWPVAAATCGLALDTARRGDGDAYGLLTIVPPAREAKAQAIARDLIVLLDTSGSMSGGPLDKAKQAVALLIDSLDEQDRLELIEFSNEPVRYKAGALPATAREKQDAIRWVRSRSANGGTEMGAAVFEALHVLRAGVQRQVIVVTDGYVGGEQQIIKLLHEKLPASCRLHVLGVGSAVNRSLATAMARAGRGAEVLIGLDEDAERGIKRMIDRTRMPMLMNVSITGSALVRHAPEHVPDVHEGAPIVAALALRPEGGELVVRGDLAPASGAAASTRTGSASEASVWEKRIRVPARPAGEGNQAIAALYAREHVADLETRWMLGDTSAIDREIEATGVVFQIATRLTSWVAIDESRTVKGPARHETVPQELPYGTSAASFGLRASAAAYGGAPGMASVASSLQASYDEEGDFGEEAPSEIVAERAPPARSMRPSAAVTRAGSISRRSWPDSAFTSDASDPASPEPEKPQAEKTTEKEQAKASRQHQVASKIVPAGYGPPPAPPPAESRLMPSIKPTFTPNVMPPRPPARRYRAFLLVALVLGLIAALVWWLVR